jgi:hypothetical protein
MCVVLKAVGYYNLSGYPGNRSGQEEGGVNLVSSDQGVASRKWPLTWQVYSQHWTWQLTKLFLFLSLLSSKSAFEWEL